MMSLLADLLLVAEDDYTRIDRALRSIEGRIADAGSNVDSWTTDQAIKLREAVNDLRVRLDDFQMAVPKTDPAVEIGKIRSEMLNIDDLRRAVATFGKFVTKWVGAH